MRKENNLNTITKNHRTIVTTRTKLSRIKDLVDLTNPNVKSTYKIKSGWKERTNS